MIGFCILDSVFLFVSLTAIPCGILMIAAPDGRFLLLDPRLVEHSLLRTYLVPGMALFLVGLASLYAWWQRRRRAQGAWRWGMAAGAMLIAFELVQIAVIQQFHMLQVVYLVCGTFIVIRSRRSVGS